MRIVLYDVNWEQLHLEYNENMLSMRSIKDFVSRDNLYGFLKVCGDIKATSENTIVVKYDSSYRYVSIDHLVRELEGNGLDIMNMPIEILVSIGVLSEKNYEILLCEGLEKLRNIYMQKILSSKCNPVSEKIKEYRFGMSSDNFINLRDISQTTKMPQEILLNLLLNKELNNLERLAEDTYLGYYEYLTSKLKVSSRIKYKRFNKDYDEYKLEYSKRDNEGNLMRDVLVILYKNGNYNGSISIDLLKLEEYLIS